ncbi:MAG: C4-type zinc ribbon domain-containing protein [Planctomycetota bacterium]|nr:C4-type zinc ribbon domain-containing protein [Planctomycetota bacterium]
MSLMENLLKLYRVDAQVRGLRSRLDSANRYFNAQSRLLDEIAQRLEELRTRKRHVQAKVSNLETEGESLDRQMEKFRADLNSASTNKQYAAVLTELNTVKAERNRIDDAILAELEQTEEIDREIEEVSARLAERAKVCDVAEAQVKERETEIGSRLSELEAERKEAASAVPGPARAIFDEMAEAHEGEAMATVEEIDRRHREYACGACNMHLPFEQVVNLTSPISELVRCPACGRILYMQEEVRGAVARK